jgi:hypothetical protein
MLDATNTWQQWFFLCRHVMMMPPKGHICWPVIAGKLEAEINSGKLLRCFADK